MMKKRKIQLNLIQTISYAFSIFAAAFFIGISVFLLKDGTGALQEQGLSFFFKADWFYRADRFGAASMLYGSFIVGAIAILLAAPISIGAAIFTSEYLRGTTRVLVKGTMELLAGIPSVVYGLLGVLFLRPFVFDVFARFSPESGDNLLTAGILVGIMIMPTILSLSDDAFRSISSLDRESARSLGLTKSEMFFHAVLPKAMPGVVAAVLLGIGRAAGETIAVYLVVGRADNRMPDVWYSLRPLLEAGQTLTSKLGGSEVYLAYGDKEHWQAIVGLGLTLFAIVIALVIIAEFILSSLKRYQT